MVERNKMQKERKLKEFRNLELLNDEQRKKQRGNGKEDVEIQNCFVCVKTQMRNNATKFAVETEKKTFN